MSADYDDSNSSKRSWAEDPLRAAAPRTLEETQLPFLFLVELLAKILFQRGSLGLTELALHVKLPVSVLDRILTFMRTERMCEMSRRGSSGTDADIVYTLSETGRSRAADYTRRASYAGPAPVTLESYTQRLQQQSLTEMLTSRQTVQQAYQNVVVTPLILNQFGAAMNSGRAMFIYGPAGSGKSYLAERLSGLLTGHIAVPYALLVDSEVVPLFDPMVHQAVQDQMPPGRLFDRRAPRDQRWVRSLRPLVMTGGELTLDTLDLRFDAATRLYQAPPHLKANGGILIIDDLGRQRCSPVELMNRWIVPMDRRIDFLRLQNGYSFPVPFDVQIVFSSNLPPEALADGAFLRRLGYKIHIDALSASQYEEVFRQVCQRYSLEFSDSAYLHLIDRYVREQLPLLACHPRDLLTQIRDLARYEGTEPQLNPDSIDWAWNNYFASQPHSSHIQQ